MDHLQKNGGVPGETVTIQFRATKTMANVFCGFYSWKQGNQDFMTVQFVFHSKPPVRDDLIQIK